MNSLDDFAVMFVSMILAGLLSTMNVFVDNPRDIRWSLNDVYMILLMTGWMFLFTGMFHQNYNLVAASAAMVAVMFLIARAQLGIHGEQYKIGMIPHHSAAVYMSKRYLARGEHDDALRTLAKNIIRSQEREIQILNVI